MCLIAAAGSGILFPGTAGTGASDKERRYL